MKIKLRNLILLTFALFIIVITAISNLMINNSENIIFNRNFKNHQQVNTNLLTQLYSYRDAVQQSNFKIAIIMLIIGIIFAIILSIILTKAINKTIESAAKVGNSEYEIPKISIIKEVNNLNLSLKDLDSRLKLKNQIRSELYDQIQHQARTPLTILNNQIEAMNDGIINAESSEFQICFNQIENLKAIISNMNLIVSANQSDDNLKLEKVNVVYLLNEVIDSMKLQFSTDKVKLNFQSDSKLEMELDKNLFKQCIYNILGNSLKYNAKKIDITLNETNGFQLIISDNGIGMSKSDLDNVFKAYYRGSNVKEVSGQGIGLYLVKNYLGLMNLNVEVNSKIHEGFTIIITS